MSNANERKIQVTPYLDDLAAQVAATWERDQRMPAIIVPHTQDLSACPNCQGYGYVYLRLCESGPYRNPPGNLSQVITWYPGNERFGKGWYVVKDMSSYPCPECKGQEAVMDEYIPPAEMVQRLRDHKPVIEALVKQMENKKQLRVRQP